MGVTMGVYAATLLVADHVGMNAQANAEGDGSNGTLLSVTGSRSPSTWEESQVASGEDKKHIDVDEFVESSIGRRFYKEWKEGRASCNLFSTRFGYGVLGRYT